MIIDIRESVTDIKLALTKTFGVSEESLDEEAGKRLIADLARIYVQHDYLAWLTNQPIEVSVMSARMASAFHAKKMGDAYVKCKAISDALVRIEGFGDSDDAPEELLRHQFEFDDFVEMAFCEDDALTLPLTGDKNSRDLVYQIVPAEGDSASITFLRINVVIQLSSVIRSLFKTTSEYNNMIRSIVISD